LGQRVEEMDTRQLGEVEVVKRGTGSPVLPFSKNNERFGSPKKWREGTLEKER